MNVNTEEIMAQIRQDIRDKGLTSDMLSFDDIPYRARMLWLKAHYYIQPYKQLAGNAVSVVAKKIVRKMAKFYVEPVVFEQNDFNANMVSVAESLTESNRKLERRIEALERENAELREKLETKRRKRK